VVDHSAVAAIQGISKRYAKNDKKVLLVNLAKKSHGRLHRTGNHKMLRRQITPAFHLHSTTAGRDDDDDDDDDIMDVEGEPGRRNPSQPPTRTDSSDRSVNDTIAIESHLLEDLPMFSTSVDPVENEVEALHEKQGEYSIHEKKE